ncbi:MAG TPA: LCP family protein, partial [Acidimicrobiales bacterium]|nr:LCP family protein [Acidimicrobiales bacterium]
MTVVSSDQRPQGDEPDADDDTSVGLDVPQVASRHPLPSVHVPAFLQRATWRFYVFSAALSVLVLAVPLLAWKGFSILRNEETGEVVSEVRDPGEPGYEALVTPTPTTMLADIGPDGTLQGVTLITLPSEEGGGNIVFFPVGTVLPVPLRQPVEEAALNVIYAESGATGLEQRIETMLGAAINEFVEVPRGQWTNLVRPVAPLTVQNPTAAETTDNAGEAVSFPAGEIQLTAEQVGLYLQADAPDEADPVRIARHEAFWNAWLAALDEAGEEAIPGEGVAGVGGVVRGLIGGPRNMSTIPASPVAVPGIPAIESDIFRPDTLAIVSEVPNLIPFPTGVGRLRTRLVIGVEGQVDRVAEIAHTLVEAGAEVSVVANADEWGTTPQTQVVYFDEDDEEKAQRLLDALGVGDLVDDESPGDTFDVVILVGEDFFDEGGDGSSGGGDGGTVPSTV